MEVTQGAPAPSLTPEAAMAERTSLIADAGFRGRYMAGGQTEADRMTQLNMAIAAGMEPQVDADAGHQPATATISAETPPEGYEPPDTPAGYVFSQDFARSRGLEVDVFAEHEVRQALHGAGVDADLGAWLYHAAAVGASGYSEAQAMTDYVNCERGLHDAWGERYDQNLALAREEAERIFQALPVSIRGQEPFDGFIESRGLGNNRRIIEILYARASGRKKQ